MRNLRQITDKAGGLPGPLITGVASLIGSTNLLLPMHPLAILIITNVTGLKEHEGMRESGGVACAHACEELREAPVNSKALIH
jgi:hypothetical protein